MNTNKNENVTYQNLWDASKVVLKGKFIAIQAYLKKLQHFQITNFTAKGTEKEQTKHKVSRKKKVFQGQSRNK